MATTQAALVDPQGTVTHLSDDAYRRLAALLDEITAQPAGSDGAGDMITTSEGARMLGVSQRTFARLLDAGDIPCVRYGSGIRRAHRGDVEAYRRRMDGSLSAGFRGILSASDAAGLYDAELEARSAGGAERA